jgi:hypothetical protein
MYGVDTPVAANSYHAVHSVTSTVRRKSYRELKRGGGCGKGLYDFTE